MRTHAARWLRMHSLPGSKRYPDSDAERAVLLARHNAAADAIIDGAPCVLLGYDDTGSHALPGDHPLRAWLPNAPPVMRLAPEDEDSDATSIFAGRLPWRPGILDAALSEVAEDRLRLILVNWATGAAYAPYDGGADLFWPTEVARDIARSRFSAWLSSHENGL